MKHDKTVEREYDDIPVRYMIAVLLSVLEVAAVIGKSPSLTEQRGTPAA